MKLKSHELASEKELNGNTWFEVNHYHELNFPKSDEIEPITKHLKSSERNSDKFGDALNVRNNENSLLIDFVETADVTQIRRINRSLFNFGGAVEGKYSGNLALVDQKLTELGVAPSCRNAQISVDKCSKNETEEFLRKFHLCMSDLFWLHSYYRESAYIQLEGRYKLLMSQSQFDDCLARDLVERGRREIEDPSKLLIHEDIQWELSVYRGENTEKTAIKLIHDTHLVEQDLRLAAIRNPRRGGKLLAYLPERIAIWQSTQLSSSKSTKINYQNYLKFNGSKISRSTYQSKLKSTNAALREVGSRYVFDLN